MRRFNRPSRCAGAVGRPGFTLIELILVMVILSIVLAMVAPNLHGFLLGRALPDTAVQLVALTRYARTQSITQGRTYWLNIDPQQRTYFLSAQAALDTAAAAAAAGSGTSDTLLSDTQQTAPYGLPLGVEMGRTFRLPDAIDLACDQSAADDGLIHLRFDPDGRTDSTTLQLTDTRAGNSLQIACLSASDVYRVQDTPKDLTP